MSQRYARRQFASPIISGHVSIESIQNPNSVSLDVQIVTDQRS